MSKYTETAKKLDIKVYLWRYGLTWSRGLDKKFRVRITRLDGWEFDPHKITEAIANDPDFSISYKKGKL